MNIDNAVRERFWTKVNKDGEIKPHMDTPCWEWMASSDAGGYGLFSVSNGRMKRAHRVSWEIQHGTIPRANTRFGTANVLHKCDNPSCVNPSHLFLGTEKDNAVDRAKKGRSVVPDNRGESHGMAKLDSAAVNEIRRLKKQDGLSQTKIAKMFGVDQSTISRAVRGEYWGHI